MAAVLKHGLRLRTRVALCVLGLVVFDAAHAQAYPSKPLRIVAPVAPGGSSDIMGRRIGQQLSEQMGVPIYVDNRPGGTALVGSEIVAKAPADGYTLLTISAEFTINPSLRKLPFDPIKDFACIRQLTTGQYILSTHPAIPVKTTRQLIVLAKSRPGQMTFGSSGTGGLNHIIGVLFQQSTGTRLVHVPYKSAALAGVALISGEIDFMFSNVASVITQIRSGKVHAIATTGAKRSPVAPEVPTLIESGLPGFVVTGYHLLLAPGATPAAIIGRLNAETAKALDSAAMREQLASFGLEPAGGSSAACTQFIQTEIARWTSVVKAGGITVD
jgi:tripartite-type tricarboxylate transporter receptor subunit TctC